MAEIALSSVMYVRPWRSPWGAFPTRSHLVVSTHATIPLGRPVTLNWTANNTSVGQIVASTGDDYFWGVGIAASSATRPASSVTEGVAIPVWEMNPLVEFRANTFGAALASSITGLRKKLVWDSTLNIAKIDLTASTATDWRVVVTGLIDNVGDTGGAVSFKFISRTGDQVNSTILSSNPLLAFFS